MELEYEIHPAKDSGPGNHFFCRLLGDRSRRKPRCPQLHLVSRGGCARLYTGAALGRTATRIHREATYEFPRAHARQSYSKLYMWGAAANLSPRAARNLAIYFSTLPPKAANDGDRERVATGRAIYQEGIPDSNIAACVACHGPVAQGVSEIPRLGGGGGSRTLTGKEGSSSGAKDTMRPQGLPCLILRANCPRTKLRPSPHI